MKNVILSLAFTGLFLFISDFSYSQDYDLIVTAKGDSIACHIDSITDTHIYFEMKNRNKWDQTYMGITDVLVYKRDAIIRKEFMFRTGSSIIESPKPAIPTSIRGIQRNSVYMGVLSLNYARMFPAGDRVGISLGGGLYHFDATGVVLESSVLVGGIKHFFEAGIMGVGFFSAYIPDDEEEDPINGATSIRMGYRFQGPEGLLLRAAPNYIFIPGDSFLYGALSIGYSF